jgi:hypothetical protein
VKIGGEGIVEAMGLWDVLRASRTLNAVSGGNVSAWSREIFERLIPAGYGKQALTTLQTI